MPGYIPDPLEPARPVGGDSAGQLTQELRGIKGELVKVGTMGQRNVIISSDAPDNSAGNNGDIWLRYQD